MNAQPKLPRSWASLTFMLFVVLVAAVPPYLVLAHLDATNTVRWLAAMLAFAPGIAAIIWVTRRV